MRANQASMDLMLVGELLLPDKVTLLRAASATDRGSLTTAGRALQKHGNRPGSVFPQPMGSPSMLNEQGLQIVDAILSDPNRVSVIRHHARFGEVLEVKGSNGQGVRYTSDGKQLIGFIE